MSDESKKVSAGYIRRAFRAVIENDRQFFVEQKNYYEGKPQVLKQRFNQRMYGEPLLMFALSFKRYEIVKCLVAGGADLNANNGTYTPLGAAVARQDLASVKRLLVLGGSPLAAEVEWSSALQLALKQGTREIVDALLSHLSKKTLSTEQQLKLSNQLAHALTSPDARNEVALDYLLEHKYFQQLTESQQIACVNECLTRHYPVVDLLPIIKNLSCTDSRGRSLLGHAIVTADTQFLELCIKKGAHIDSIAAPELRPPSDVLGYVIVNMDVRALQVLLENGFGKKYFEWQKIEAIKFALNAKKQGRAELIYASIRWKGNLDCLGLFDLALSTGDLGFASCLLKSQAAFRGQMLEKLVQHTRDQFESGDSVRLAQFGLDIALKLQFPTQMRSEGRKYYLNCFNKVVGQVRSERTAPASNKTWVAQQLRQKVLEYSTPADQVLLQDTVWLTERHFPMHSTRYCIHPGLNNLAVAIQKKQSIDAFMKLKSLKAAGRDTIINFSKEIRGLAVSAAAKNMSKLALNLFEFAHEVNKTLSQDTLVLAPALLDVMLSPPAQWPLLARILQLYGVKAFERKPHHKVTPWLRVVERAFEDVQPAIVRQLLNGKPIEVAHLKRAIDGNVDDVVLAALVSDGSLLKQVPPEAKVGASITPAITKELMTHCLQQSLWLWLNVFLEKEIPISDEVLLKLLLEAPEPIVQIIKDKSYRFKPNAWTELNESLVNIIENDNDEQEVLQRVLAAGFKDGSQTSELLASVLRKYRCARGDKRHAYARAAILLVVAGAQIDRCELGELSSAKIELGDFSGSHWRDADRQLLTLASDGRVYRYFKHRINASVLMKKMFDEIKAHNPTLGATPVLTNFAERAEAPKLDSVGLASLLGQLLQPQATVAPLSMTGRMTQVSPVVVPPYLSQWARKQLLQPFATIVHLQPLSYDWLFNLRVKFPENADDAPNPSPPTLVFLHHKVSFKDMKQRLQAALLHGLEHNNPALVKHACALMLFFRMKPNKATFDNWRLRYPWPFGYGLSSANWDRLRQTERFPTWMRNIVDKLNTSEDLVSTQRLYDPDPSLRALRQLDVAFLSRHYANQSYEAIEASLYKNLRFAHRFKDKRLANNTLALMQYLGVKFQSKLLPQVKEQGQPTTFEFTAFTWYQNIYNKTYARRYQKAVQVFAASNAMQVLQAKLDRHPAYSALLSFPDCDVNRLVDLSQDPLQTQSNLHKQLLNIIVNAVHFKNKQVQRHAVALLLYFDLPLPYRLTVNNTSQFVPPIDGLTPEYIAYLRGNNQIPRRFNKLLEQFQENDALKNVRAKLCDERSLPTVAPFGTWLKYALGHGNVSALDLRTTANTAPDSGILGPVAKPVALNPASLQSLTKGNKEILHASKSMPRDENSDHTDDNDHPAKDTTAGSQYQSGSKL